MSSDNPADRIDPSANIPLQPRAELNASVYDLPQPRNVGGTASTRTLTDIAVALSVLHNTNDPLDAHDENARLMLRVPGRTLPRGHSWSGHDIPGRGHAASRRLRQLERAKRMKELTEKYVGLKGQALEADEFASAQAVQSMIDRASHRVEDAPEHPPSALPTTIESGLLDGPLRRTK